MNFKDALKELEAEPLFIRAERVGQIIGLSTTKVRAMARDGSLPTSRVGKTRMFPRLALAEWLAGKSAGESVK